MESQPSLQKAYNLRFGEILALPANVEASLSYWVTDSLFHQIIPVEGERQSMLEKFLNDNPVHDDPIMNPALVWWDIAIKFRDTDESVKEELTRLCFDVQSGVLYATVPPYTERGFKPPKPRQ